MELVSDQPGLRRTGSVVESAGVGEMESLGVIQALLVVSAVVVVAEDLVEEMVAVYPAGDASVPVSVPGKVNQQTSLWNRPDKAAVEVRTMVDVRSVMQVCDVTVADGDEQVFGTGASWPAFDGSSTPPHPSACGPDSSGDGRELRDIHRGLRILHNVLLLHVLHDKNVREFCLSIRR